MPQTRVTQNSWVLTIYPHSSIATIAARLEMLCSAYWKASVSASRYTDLAVRYCLAELIERFLAVIDSPQKLWGQRTILIAPESLADVATVPCLYQ